MLSAAVNLLGRELVVNGSRAANEIISISIDSSGLDLEAKVAAGPAVLIDEPFAIAFVKRIKVVCGNGPFVRGEGFQGQTVMIGDTSAPVITPTIIIGGRGNDTLLGGAGPDTILGGRGNDLIVGGAEHNVLYGGAGNDTIFGGPAADLIFGGRGDDQIQSGGTASPSLQDADGMLPLAGDDTIYAGAGADVVSFYPDLDLAHVHLGRHDVINTTGIPVPPAAVAQ